MNDTLPSRREFLQTTVRGAVALPLLASLGMTTMATGALAERTVAMENSLCLFEAEAALGANMSADLRRLGLAYQAITLAEAVCSNSAEERAAFLDRVWASTRHPEKVVDLDEVRRGRARAEMFIQALEAVHPS